jgi:hypothetical protein
MNEKYIFGLVVVATTIFATISIVSDVLVSSIGVPSTSLTYNTAVCKVITRADGTVEDLGCSHNLVSDGGKDFLKECLGDGACGAPTAFTNMTIGNCTVSQTGAQTELCGGQDYSDGACGLGPSNPTDGPTYSSAGTGAWNITATWTSNCDNVIVNATALYNNTLMFAQNNFTTVTLMSSDQINVTWGIWVT